MTVIDTSVRSGTQPLFNVKIPVSALVAAASASIAFAVMARHGFNDAGVRLASEVAWRFASFVFFAAVIAGPLCRLIPADTLKQLSGFRRQIIWSFSASYAVFLAVMLLPNMMGTAARDASAMGMILFSLFGGGAAAIMPYAASPAAGQRLGEKSQRALLSVAASFFWLTYALTGLAHLSGPHRPDNFYGISLSLMLVALLVRFADRFVAKLMGTSRPSLQA